MITLDKKYDLERTIIQIWNIKKVATKYEYQPQKGIILNNNGIIEPIQLKYTRKVLLGLDINLI